MSTTNCFECVKSCSVEEAIQCDGCKRHMCITCSGLTSSEIKVMGLKTKRTMLFLCPPCREGLFQVPTLIKTVAALREDVQKLQQNLSAGGGSASTLDRASSKPALSDLIEEMEDRETRARNFILIGASESDDLDSTVRIQHDQNLVKKIIDTTASDLDSGEVLKVVRLGKKVDGKTRPIKVVLKSRSSVIKVLKNRGKVQRPYKIFNDQTPKQREELRLLREELKQRQDAGETDITIKYYKGNPKIIRTKN